MKYDVEITKKVLYTFTVEANNEEDAEYEAYGLYEVAEYGGNLGQYYTDEDLSYYVRRTD